MSIHIPYVQHYWRGLAGEIMRKNEIKGIQIGKERNNCFYSQMTLSHLCKNPKRLHQKCEILTGTLNKNMQDMQTEISKHFCEKLRMT